jgi:hypothetical protein
MVEEARIIIMDKEVCCDRFKTYMEEYNLVKFDKGQSYYNLHARDCEAVKIRFCPWCGKKLISYNT